MPSGAPSEQTRNAVTLGVVPMPQSNAVKNLAASVLTKIARRIFGMPFWLLYVLVLGFCLLQNGLAVGPQTPGLLQASTDITVNPFIVQRGDEWLLSSYLGPVLGYVTSMNRSILSYFLLHVIVFLVCFTMLIAVIRRSSGDFAARCVTLAFMLSPISNVLFTWVGSPDILTTLLAMTVVVFSGNPLILGLSAFLLGTNHPEQGLAILVLLTMMCIHTRRALNTVKFAAVSMGCLTMGILAVQWWFSSHNFDVLFTRLHYFVMHGLFPHMRASLSNPFALVFSLFNVLILFVAAYVVYFWKKDRVAVGLVVYSVLAFITVLFTLDQTRVFAVITFPALVLAIISPSFARLKGSERRFFEMVLTICFVAGILLPRFVVWNGAIYGSVYPAYLQQLEAILAPRAG